MAFEITLNILFLPKEEVENAPGTTITWAEYCEQGIWIVQQGTGSLLLVKPKHNKILKYGPFPGAWEENITALKFMYVSLICNM